MVVSLLGEGEGMVLVVAFASSRNGGGGSHCTGVGTVLRQKRDA